MMEIKDGPATRRSSLKGRPHRNWPKGTGAGESLGWDGELGVGRLVSTTQKKKSWREERRDQI